MKHMKKQKLIQRGRLGEKFTLLDWLNENHCKFDARLWSKYYISKQTCAKYKKLATTLVLHGSLLWFKITNISLIILGMRIYLFYKKVLYAAKKFSLQKRNFSARMWAVWFRHWKRYFIIQSDVLFFKHTSYIHVDRHSLMDSHIHRHVFMYIRQ